jgi:quinol monooxygenase YgiN
VSGEETLMAQVTNLAFFRARRGRSEALGVALAALVEPTRLEAGCLDYDLHRSVDDPDVWFVYENWRSPEGFDAHMLSEHLQAFLKTMPDLVAGNIDLRRFRMISCPATHQI